MPSTWTHLLFLHGHVADADLARRLAGSAPAPRRRDVRWLTLHAWLRRLGRRTMRVLSR